ncbi:MAG: thioesterase domain-containing protein [Pseudomonadota bacterium]
MLGYLLTKRIVNAGKPAPLHLFVSGRIAPSVVVDDPPKYLFPKQVFISHVNELGGLPPKLLEYTELMDFLEPVLRADFQAIETYVYQPASPFDIPITILHGLADKVVAYRDLLPWQQESCKPIAIKTFSGGTFLFLSNCLFQLGQLFSRTLINTEIGDKSPTTNGQFLIGAGRGCKPNAIKLRIND